MADNCGSYVSADDLQAAKQSILHIEHVATSKDAAGNPAQEVTDTIRGNNVTNKTLDGLFADIGFKPVDGSFQAGGTINHRWEVLLNTADNSYYQWMGALPKVVQAGSTPDSTGGVGSDAWVNQSDLTLRSELVSTDISKGDALISVKADLPDSANRTQHQKNSDFVSVYDFSTPYLALTSGATNIYFKSGTYNISSPVTIPVGTTLHLESGVIFTGSLITINGDVRASRNYSSTIPYPKGFVVSLNDNLYCAKESTFNISPENDNGTKWHLMEVNNPVELLIPSRFTNESQALNFISGASLNSKTTIRWQQGVYNVSSISPNVKNGYNLWFSGQENDRSLVKINIGTGDGFVCLAGMSYSISDLTVQSSNWKSHGSWTGVSNGILATQGGRIYCKNVHVTKCYYGFQAAIGGVIDAEDCESSEAGDGGFFAFNGGHINALNCPSHDNYDSGFLAVLGFGYVAEAGGTMWVRNAQTYGSVAGVFANIGSSIRCDGLNCYGNGNGIIVKAGSVIESNSSTINNNISDNVRVLGGSHYNCSGTHQDSSQSGGGIIVDGGSTINCQSSTTSNNASYGISCSLLSSAKLNSSHVSTGNGTAAYSPALGASGNKNSWIDN